MKILFKSFTIGLCGVFTFTTLLSSSEARAQSVVVSPSVLAAGVRPAMIAGMTIDPDHPFQFEFIVDTGSRAGEESRLPSGDARFPAASGSLQNPEALKLIHYFLAALTVPEQDMWVNLSPAEPDRIIARGLGQTAMGRDMLAQDYVLKQLTASLMSPEGESGRKFWERIYQKIYEDYNSPQPPLYTKRGSNQLEEGIPPSFSKEGARGSYDQIIESFNKVWIVPDQASVYVHGRSVFVVGSHLKVMMESDYVAQQQSKLSSPDVIPAKAGSHFNNDNGSRRPTEVTDMRGVKARDDNFDVKDIIRSTIIPLIEDEVNNGESFAPLRQMFNSMILATWYKKNLKESLLAKVYADQNKVEGIKLSVIARSEATKQSTKNEIASASGLEMTVEDIYHQYLAAFRSGANDIIREEYDPATQSVTPRKYFTGGVIGVSRAMLSDSAQLDTGNLVGRAFSNVKVDLVNSDSAMLEDDGEKNAGKGDGRDEKDVNRHSKPVEIHLREADTWKDLDKQHQQDMEAIRQKQADERIQNNAMLMGKDPLVIWRNVFFSVFVAALSFRFFAPAEILHLPFVHVLTTMTWGFAGVRFVHLWVKYQKERIIRTWKFSREKQELAELLVMKESDDVVGVDEMIENIQNRLDQKLVFAQINGDEMILPLDFEIILSGYVLSRAHLIREQMSPDSIVLFPLEKMQRAEQTLSEKKGGGVAVAEGQIIQELLQLDRLVKHQRDFYDGLINVEQALLWLAQEDPTAEFFDELENYRSDFKQSHIKEYLRDNAAHFAQYRQRLLARIDQRLMTNRTYVLAKGASARLEKEAIAIEPLANAALRIDQWIKNVQDNRTHPEKKFGAASNIVSLRKEYDIFVRQLRAFNAAGDWGEADISGFVQDVLDLSIDHDPGPFTHFQKIFAGVARLKQKNAERLRGTRALMMIARNAQLQKSWKAYLRTQPGGVSGAEEFHGAFSDWAMMGNSYEDLVRMQAELERKLKGKFGNDLCASGGSCGSDGDHFVREDEVWHNLETIQGRFEDEGMTSHQAAIELQNLENAALHLRIIRLAREKGFYPDEDDWAMLQALDFSDADVYGQWMHQNVEDKDLETSLKIHNAAFVAEALRKNREDRNDVSSVYVRLPWADNDAMRDYAQRVQAVMTEVLMDPDHTKAFYQKPEDLHATLSTEGSPEETSVYDVWSAIQDALKTMGPVNVRILGPRLMPDLGVILELEALTPDVYRYRQAADQRMPSKSAGSRAYVQNIFHVTLGYLYEASEEQLQALYDRFVQWRETEDVVETRASSIEVVEGHGYNASEIRNRKTHVLADSAALNPGGIDFNSQKMNFTEQGGTMRLDLSNKDFDPAQLRNLRGLRPVIRSIVPIADIRPLLGLDVDPDKKQDVSAIPMEKLGRKDV